MAIVSLVKQVNETYTSVTAAMEKYGTLSPQQKDMLFEALEYVFKQGYKRGKESNDRS